MRITTVSLAAVSTVALLAGCNTDPKTPQPLRTTVSVSPSTSVSVRPSTSVSVSPVPSTSVSASASPSASRVTDDARPGEAQQTPGSKTSTQVVNDAGLRRCNQFSKSLADGKNPLSTELTAVEYGRVRADFRASRYADVREAGVALLDVYIAGAGSAKLDSAAVTRRAAQLAKACNART